MAGFYFLNHNMRGAGAMSPLRESFDLPVKIEKNKWQHLDNPRRIAKIFTFDDFGQQAYFVSEVMEAIGTNRHPVKISIESNTVQIETRTDLVDDITEIDLEIARNVDEMYNDALYVLVTQ